MYDALLPLFFGSMAVLVVFSAVLGSWRQGTSRTGVSLSFVITAFIAIFFYSLIDIEHLKGLGLIVAGLAGVVMFAIHFATPAYWRSVYERLGKLEISVEPVASVVRAITAGLAVNDQPTEAEAVLLKGLLRSQGESGGEGLQGVTSTQGSRSPESLVADCRARVVLAVSTSMAQHRARATMSLAIGLLISVVGIPVAAWVLAVEEGYRSNTELVLLYGSRVAFLIVVEILALFFLKIYREASEDIKFYTAEIATLESLFAAVETSLAVAGPEKALKLLMRLSETERNRVLKAGETTERIQMHRMDALDMTSILDQVTDKAIPQKQQ